MVHKVFAHELRGCNGEGEAQATGVEIIRGLFGWWKELMQNMLGWVNQGRF